MLTVERGPRDASRSGVVLEDVPRAEVVWVHNGVGGGRVLQVLDPSNPDSTTNVLIAVTVRRDTPTEELRRIGDWLKSFARRNAGATLVPSS